MNKKGGESRMAKNIKKEIISYIESILADISPETVTVYKTKFEEMTDKQIIDFFKHNDIRLFVNDKDMTQKKIDTLVKRTGYIAEENIRYPEKNNSVSNRKMMVLPIQIRRLQQVSSTESNSSIDTSVRDKVNQATRESRTSKLTDTEVAIMASVGLDRTLSELLSPRSDNQLSKNKMNELIREKGTFKLSELPKTPKSRNSVLYLDALYKAMNIATDLVDDINDIS